MDQAVREYMASLGRKGGAVARGDSKRRPPGHYQQLGKLARARAAERRERMAAIVRGIKAELRQGQEGGQEIG